MQQHQVQTVCQEKEGGMQRSHSQESVQNKAALHRYQPPSPNTHANAHTLTAAPPTYLLRLQAMCCNMCAICCRDAGPCASRIHSFSARMPHSRNSSRKAGSAGATDISSIRMGSTTPQNSKGNFGSCHGCFLPRRLLLRRRAASRASM